MLLDRGLMAQEPHGGLLVGGQLREHDEVPDACLDEIGETPLLRLSLFRGGRDQISPPGAVQPRGNRCRIAEVGDRSRNAVGEPAAVRRRPYHGPHRRLR